MCPSLRPLTQLPPPSAEAARGAGCTCYFPWLAPQHPPKPPLTVALTLRWGLCAATPESPVPRRGSHDELNRSLQGPLLSRRWPSTQTWGGMGGWAGQGHSGNSTLNPYIRGLKGRFRPPQVAFFKEHSLEQIVFVKALLPASCSAPWSHLTCLAVHLSVCVQFGRSPPRSEPWRARLSRAGNT